MALNLVIPSSGGGGWYKPEDSHTEYTAFLIEVKDFEHQRPGQYGPKDSALVDMTQFRTREELTNGTPNVINGTRVEQTKLAEFLGSVGKGNGTIVILKKVPSKQAGRNPAWIYEGASTDVQAKVIEYVNQRDAALDAAIANAPSFD